MDARSASGFTVTASHDGEMVASAHFPLAFIRTPHHVSIGAARGGGVHWQPVLPLGVAVPPPMATLVALAAVAALLPSVAGQSVDCANSLATLTESLKHRYLRRLPLAARPSSRTDAPTP
jgi:hypothetical protein